MGNSIEVAKNRIFGEDGLNAGNFSIYPGTNPDATPEEIANEINKGLDRFFAGDYDVVELE